MNSILLNISVLVSLSGCHLIGGEVQPFKDMGTTGRMDAGEIQNDLGTAGDVSNFDTNSNSDVGRDTISTPDLLDMPQMDACGNGAIDSDEACDGVLFGEKNCVSEGFVGGVLLCSAECKLDVTKCEPGGKISSGYLFSCHLDSQGETRCWGSDEDGIVSASVGMYTKLFSGNSTACGLDKGENLECWGNTENIPTQPPGQFVDIAIGDSHLCGILTDGRIQCFGDNYWGQSNAPEGIFKEIDAGYGHNCALMESGEIKCWGANASDQSTPPSGTFVRISIGHNHGCAIRDDETVQCWGDNIGFPQGSFEQISSGSYFTCGIRPDKSAHCWGSNDFRQQDIPANTSYVELSAGAQHVCGVKLDGTLVCWGDNAKGQATP